MTKINDSEYTAAWQEMDEQPVNNSAVPAALKQPKPKAESGFMDKLSVVKDALLTSNKPRTSTAAVVR
jgi:hypothetical protein